MVQRRPSRKSPCDIAAAMVREQGAEKALKFAEHERICARRARSRVLFAYWQEIAEAIVVGDDTPIAPR